MENAALPKSPPAFFNKWQNAVVTKSEVKVLIIFFCSSFFLMSIFYPNTINNLNVA